MKKTLLFTVAYKQPHLFYKDFFNCIQEQDTKEFDLLIINEGINLEQFTSKLSIDVNNLYASGNIVDNRMLAFNYAVVNGYENILALDIDDYCSSNRISTIIKALENCDIYVHDLTLVNVYKQLYKDNFVGNRFHYGNIFYKDILDKNFIGFGNSGFKVRLLKGIQVIPNSIIAVDWFVFSIFLLNNVTVIYEQRTLTYYRQHNENIAGAEIKSIQQLKQQINILDKHYKALLGYMIENNICKYINEINEYINNINTIIIMQLYERLNNYIKLRFKKNDYIWWELINISVKEFNKWQA